MNSTPSDDVRSANLTDGNGGPTPGPDAPDPSSTSVPPAAGTSTQGRRRSNPSRPRLRRPYAQQFQNEVAMLRAQGMSRNKIAKALGSGSKTIALTERLPSVQAQIESLRSHWKMVSHSKIQTMADQTWDMAKDCVAQRDPKGFDYTLRGIHAMEKVSASVSGEGQKVELSGAVQTNSPHIELKVLLAQLLNK